MPSYVELRPPQWTGRPPIRVELPRDIVQDLAMATGEDWPTLLVEAVKLEQPEGYRRFLLALDRPDEQATVAFNLAADELCAAAEVVRYVSEVHKRLVQPQHVAMKRRSAS